MNRGRQGATQGVGVPASPSGYSAEPEPSCTVSAVPVSIPNARETALSWIDEYEREMLAERKAQYGIKFSADQQAAIEQSHRQLRAGVNIMADAIAMEARQGGDGDNPAPSEGRQPGPQSGRRP